MEVLNASDVKQCFGDALIKTQQGPVGINQNGKPVAVMLSAKAYAELQTFREIHLGQQIETGMEDIKAGRVSKGQDVIQRMKKRIRDANL